MAKGNIIYTVVVYVGDFSSHDRRVIYSTSKQSQAEKYLHDYCKEHDEVSKAYIERSFCRQAQRDAKRRYEDEDL